MPIPNMIRMCQAGREGGEEEGGERREGRETVIGSQRAKRGEGEEEGGGEGGIAEAKINKSNISECRA